MTHEEWTRRLNAWREIHQKAHAIAQRVNAMRDARGWALAASVGIPRCGCSLHNASIDTNLTGWCAGNPRRLKVAKAARRILDDWSATRLADSISQRAYERIVRAPS